jgi:hypothetical protein
MTIFGCAANPKTQELIAIEVTDDKVADCTILPKLIDNSPKTVQKVNADGAYDRSSYRKYLFNKVYVVVFLQEDMEKSEMK